eukprot:1129319-Pyramimonas_sp.AAC.1
MMVTQRPLRANASSSIVELLVFAGGSGARWAGEVRAVPEAGLAIAGERADGPGAFATGARGVPDIAARRNRTCNRDGVSIEGSETLGLNVCGPT